MATLSDLKAKFFAAVTGKRNRTDAEMAYYELAAAGGIPFADPEELEDGNVLVWDADEEKWVPSSGGGGGGSVSSEDITDATEVGRQVLTAADAPAGRTAIGAASAADLDNVFGIATAAIPAPASPSSGQVLAYNGSTWEGTIIAVLPTPPGSGNFILQANNGTLSWVTISSQLMGIAGAGTEGNVLTVFDYSGTLNPAWIAPE